MDTDEIIRRLEHLDRELHSVINDLKKGTKPKPRTLSEMQKLFTDSPVSEKDAKKFTDSISEKVAQRYCGE